MIVPFPITFFVSALLTDLAYLNTGRAGFADASMWLLGAGVASALFAAVFGFTDLISDAAIRALRQAWLHMGGNLLLVVLEAVNIYWRASGGMAGTVSASQTVLSAVAVVLLLFNGWMGWAMVYRRRVGISDEAELTGLRRG